MACAEQKIEANAESYRRASICRNCGHNVRGDCALVAMKHPGRASISHGVKRMELQCPEQRWSAIPKEQLRKTRCRKCTRLWHCNLDQECAICVNLRTIARKNSQPPPPVRPPRITHDLAGFHGPQSMIDGEWFVAITTSPRKGCTLNQCIESMRVAGWEPTVFAEPKSTKTNAQTLANPTKLGVWRNWLASAHYALENTTARLILTVQDDAIFHPESRSFMESIAWPAKDAAFVSLYTPKHYSRGRNRGINRIATRSLWGACALVWDRDALAKVIHHPIAVSWVGVPGKGGQSVFDRRKADPSLIANSDTAIGKICNALGMSMWFVDPSPVYHAAVHSTIAHGDNTGRRNCGRCADHSLPLADQVMPSKSR